MSAVIKKSGRTGVLLVDREFNTTYESTTGVPAAGKAAVEPATDGCDQSSFVIFPLVPDEAPKPVAGVAPTSPFIVPIELTPRVPFVIGPFTTPNTALAYSFPAPCDLILQDYQLVPITTGGDATDTLVVSTAAGAVLTGDFNAAVNTNQKAALVDQTKWKVAKGALITITTVKAHAQVDGQLTLKCLPQ